MDLLNLFDHKTLFEAKELYNEKKITLIKKDDLHVEALVFDEYFYKVEITLNKEHSILWPRVSKDGFSTVCPFTKPYVATVLYLLYRNQEYGLTYNRHQTPYKPENTRDFDFMSYPTLSNMRCYQKLLENITRHILRIQIYNTDATLATFSRSIDDLFEYFDSISHPKEKLIALQLFLHIYKQLNFDFMIEKDVEASIVDECNLRIHEIIENEMHPLSRYYYQSILLNDSKITPYIYDYNKSSPLR